MNIACLRNLPIIRFSLLFAVCWLQLSQTGLSQPVRMTVMPGSDQPEMLTFPSMVTPQKLEPVKEAFEADKSYQIHFSTLPHKNSNKPQHIQVPPQGPLQLTLKPGPGFALIDANGIDGQATVQFPADVYQGDLRLGDPASSSQPLSLKYEDPLYFVDHIFGGADLKPNANHGWNLGSRILPVPADWHSDHGQNLVLKLSNQGLSDFTMRWVRTPGKQVAFPPGIKEIGPEGGTVELPGVAKLEVPTAAIEKKTLVKLSQIKRVPSRGTVCYLNGDECDPGMDFASAVVKVEPFQLNLKAEAKLYIPTNKQRLGINHPSTISYLASENLEPDSWDFDPYIGFDYSNKVNDINQLTDDGPFIIKGFFYFSKQIPSNIKPESGSKPYIEKFLE